MRVTTDLDQLPLANGPPAVVSIGVFDGLHLGHQAILSANCERAARQAALATVVTFDKHPKAFLLGRAPRTLTTLEHRLRHFERLGIEHTLVLEFNQTLRETPARDFVQGILLDGLRAQTFVLGFDSKFGSGREGDADFLRSMGHEVQVIQKIEVSQRAVSSTAIREAVELGDLAGAERMLGRPVSVYGQVVRGDGIGLSLGFPTANLNPHHELLPPTGVYAGWARLDPLNQNDRDAKPLPAVANIGFRPTLDGVRPERPLFEVHLLEGGRDLYDQHLEFEFAARLREEQRFENLKALTHQIALDCEAARQLLA